MTKYLNIEEVILFNHLLIEGHGGQEQSGVKDLNMLESAIERPKQTVFGEDAYPTVFLKAAALFESLAKNHSFHNANKRTAFLSTVTFLSLNGYEFEMSQKQAEDFTVNVVLHVYTLQELADILQQHCE